MKNASLREFVRAVLAEHSTLTAPIKRLLLKVDNMPYHMCPIDELEDSELLAVDELVSQGYLRHMPADARFPERVVLTSAGSHATGTFDMDTLSQERSRSRRPNRR